MIISLWSGPRNCSTALMYSFAQRNDMEVMDEPVFGHFLQTTGVERPSRSEVLSSMALDKQDILLQIENEGKPHVFLKHMANHMEGWDTLSDFTPHKQVILIRKPVSVLASYQRHIEQPTRLDLCYDHQWDWLQACEARGQGVYVLDSDELIADPESQLKGLCHFLGLSWDVNMLRWDVGPRKEDGVWAKYWYQRIHASSGWESPSPKVEKPDTSKWNANLKNLLREVQPIFERLRDRTSNNAKI